MTSASGSTPSTSPTPSITGPRTGCATSRTRRPPRRGCISTSRSETAMSTSMHCSRPCAEPGSSTARTDSSCPMSSARTSTTMPSAAIRSSASTNSSPRHRPTPAADHPHPRPAAHRCHSRCAAPAPQLHSPAPPHHFDMVGPPCRLEAVRRPVTTALWGCPSVSSASCPTGHQRIIRRRVNTMSGQHKSLVDLPPDTKGPHTSRLGIIAVVATFGGLLFGYDTGVVNGALEPLTHDFGLTPRTEGIVVSFLTIGAAFGAVIGGRLSGAFGRRSNILLLATFFIGGTLACSLAPNWQFLAGARFFLGLAVGAASTTVPVYLAELAPFEKRGSLVTRNEVMIVVGQFAAFVINAIIFNIWGEHEGVWRYMLAV